MRPLIVAFTSVNTCESYTGDCVFSLRNCVIFREIQPITSYHSSHSSKFAFNLSNSMLPIIHLNFLPFINFHRTFETRNISISAEETEFYWIFHELTRDWTGKVHLNFDIPSRSHDRLSKTVFASLA